MATKTEIYGLNKPDGTDPMNVDLLNENMDIIERELQNHTSDTGAVGEVSFDLTGLTMHFGETAGYIYPITERVDVEALIAALDAKNNIRLVFRHLGKDVSVLMTNNATRSCSGTVEMVDSNGDLIRGVFTLDVSVNCVKLTAEFNPGSRNTVTAALDFTHWDEGYFTERFADDTAQVHLVTRDDTGAITAIGGISIVGVI